LGNPLIRFANWADCRPMQRFAGRYRRDIPRRLVVALQGFGFRYWLRCRAARSRAELYSVFEQEGRRFAEKCTKYLDVDHDTFFGYSSASLEAIRHERKSGRWCIHDQIDPSRTEQRIVEEEEARFPDLVADHTRIPESYFRRLDAEWNEASVVVVNSEWSRRALLEQGADASKIVVIPLAYRGGIQTTGISQRERRPSDPLKVLWLGTLCLRKGLPYALEAAKLLLGAPVSFTFAGAAEVPPGKLPLPENCRYLGAIPRVNVPDIYAQHDVFILPTLSDGFALTQVEALHYGLPVIATPCCGEVVMHGKSGFIVPPRSARAIADAILQLVEEQSLLCTMSLAAHRRAGDFSPDSLSQAWMEATRPKAASAPG